MRWIHQMFLLLISILLLAVTTSAMQPGPTNIRECPQCQVQLKQDTLWSSNTFHARLWTDGKMIAPMDPDLLSFVKCPKCGNLFWINDAKKLGEEPPFGSEKKWPDAVYPASPTEEDYLAIVSGESLSKERELYARRRAWWAANDAIRMNPEAKVQWSSEQAQNLRSLAALLDNTNPGQLIMKAEILRELGNFGECVTLLVQPFSQAFHQRVANLIRSLAEQNSQVVSEIKKD